MMMVHASHDDGACIISVSVFDSISCIMYKYMCIVVARQSHDGVKFDHMMV